MKQPVSKKKCPICDFCGSKVQELDDHFNNDHQIVLHTSHHHFSSLKQFNLWKEAIENETKACFVKYSGAKVLVNSQQSISYVCHRSGTYTSKSKGLRLLKSQGSNKINGFCPARIKVITFDDGSCEVVFCETHVGHENDLNHLFLNSSEKERLAAKIAQDVSFCTILKEVHDSQQDLQSERLCLLKRKDLHNIKQRLSRQSSTPSQTTSEESGGTNGEDEDKKSDLMIDCGDSVWIKSDNGLADHDYMCSKNIDTKCCLSLSEEKKKLQTNVTKIISSLSSMEEVQVMKKIIASIKPSLEEVIKRKEVTVEETSAVTVSNGNYITKCDNTLHRRLIIVKGTRQIVIHNPQQIN
ncbi:uncharacterized protein LOC135139399 isoform X2 [Zophobas morio]